MYKGRKKKSIEYSGHGGKEVCEMKSALESKGELDLLVCTLRWNEISFGWSLFKGFRVRPFTFTNMILIHGSSSPSVKYTPGGLMYKPDLKICNLQYHYYCLSFSCICKEFKAGK